MKTLINFVNENIKVEDIPSNAIFLCSVGYEERSYYLLDQFRKKLSANNILVFAFKNHLSRTNKPNRIDEAHLSNVKVHLVEYADFDIFYNSTLDFIREKISLDSNAYVYIDYSYMPRKWYCKLPLKLTNDLNIKNKIVFLYSEGTYPDNYEEFPSAGIKSFESFSGKSSLRTSAKRTHVIALSYDKIRTEGVLSTLDPESFIACNAYDVDDKEIHNNVMHLNKSIISRATLSISFHMDDFSFMIAKLCEIANEYLPLGDVIIIPDGPKPLIFALSLIPDILKKNGITCMQILRNDNDDNPNEVLPSGKVVGFSICQKEFL